MLKTTQKIIKIGSSSGITIPTKYLSNNKLKLGDEVEVTIKPINKSTSKDQEILDTAKKILNDYRRDFENLADR